MDGSISVLLEFLKTTQQTLHIWIVWFMSIRVSLENVFVYLQLLYIFTFFELKDISQKYQLLGTMDSLKGTNVTWTWDLESDLFGFES